MNRIAEENSARRTQSFDTVLPHDVRKRFTRPQRPRTLGRLEFPDRNILWLAGAIVFGAMIVALAIGLAGTDFDCKACSNCVSPSDSGTRGGWQACACNGNDRAAGNACETASAASCSCSPSAVAYRRRAAGDDAIWARGRRTAKGKVAIYRHVAGVWQCDR